MLPEYKKNQRVFKTNFVKKYKKNPLVYKYLMYPEFPPEPTEVDFGEHGKIELGEDDITDPMDIIQQIQLENGDLHFMDYEVEDHITFSGMDFPIKQFIDVDKTVEVYADETKKHTFKFSHFGMGVWLPWKIEGWDPSALQLYKTYWPDQTENIDKILYF